MSQRFIRSVVAGSLVLVLAGCAAGTRMSQTAPPPMPAAPTEVRTAQPGSDYVWVPGYYVWRASDNAYVWVPGHWTVPPAGHVWVPGHWETRAGGYTWVDGRWQKT